MPHPHAAYGCRRVRAHSGGSLKPEWALVPPCDLGQVTSLTWAALRVQWDPLCTPSGALGNAGRSHQSQSVFSVESSGEARGGPLNRKKLFICCAHRPPKCPGSFLHPQRIPSPLRAKRGALAATGAVTGPPSSDEAPGPRPWKNLGESFARRQYFSTAPLRPPQLAFCCADRRQREPGRPIRNPPKTTLRPGGKDTLCWAAGGILRKRRGGR